MTGDAPGFKWIDRPEDLGRVLRALEESDTIGVDTESDSMHSYFEKVCLIQLATESEYFLLDPLALKEHVRRLAPVFESSRIRKVFHGADYDVVCLKRDFGFDIEHLFDTMVAAQFVGLPRFGLADLVEEFFGERLEKKHSRTNWARRPLSRSELLYSYLDVRYLLGLRRRLETQLIEADVLEEAQLEFGRLSRREQEPREFDPDSYRKIRGAKDLDERKQAILRELFVWRDRQARRMDRPPFKVMSADTLLRLAQRSPKNRGEMSPIKGVTSYVMRRFADPVLKAVERGRRRGRPPAPRRRRSSGTRLSPRQRRTADRLKAWRKVKSAERGLPTIVVMSNHAISDMIRAHPSDIASLAAIPTVGEKRARLYGTEILELLG